MKDTAQKTEVVLYDAKAQQFIKYEVTGDGAKYDMTQVFDPINANVNVDEAIFEYDRLREVLLEGGEKQTDIKTNTVEADNYLFDALCIDVQGFDGEKPENWQNEISLEEKQLFAKELLNFKILDEDPAKAATGKRQWGKSLSKNTIELKCRFNNEIVICKATFADKRPGDVAMYSTMRSRVALVETDLDESAIKIPGQIRRKSEFFNKLKPQVEGYVDDIVPVHHQAAFITAFFEPTISKTEKK